MQRAFGCTHNNKKPPDCRIFGQRPTDRSTSDERACAPPSNMHRKPALHLLITSERRVRTKKPGFTSARSARAASGRTHTSHPVIVFHAGSGRMVRNLHAHMRACGCEPGQQQRLPDVVGRCMRWWWRIAAVRSAVLMDSNLLPTHAVAHAKRNLMSAANMNNLQCQDRLPAAGAESRKTLDAVRPYPVRYAAVALNAFCVAFCAGAQAMQYMVCFGRLSTCLGGCVRVQNACITACAHHCIRPRDHPMFQSYSNGSRCADRGVGKLFCFAGCRFTKCM